MAKKQSVLKLAREKQKESERDDKNRVKKVNDTQANRLELKSIMKKAGHNSKQIDEIVANMKDSEIQVALDNFKANNS
jgi:hypothetical protein